MKPPAVAVWDIGKSNSKFTVVASEQGAIRASVTQAFGSLDGPPYRHLDTNGQWDWACATLKQLAGEFDIDAIVVTTHGATAALIDDDGLVLPVLDYEDPSPEECEEQYAYLRPDFSETFSPPLPGSLNYGRGLYWQSVRFGQQFSQAKHILSYPQYWPWRLCGLAATEVTSIGSHSDLWAPNANDYSSLVAKLNWQDLFPAMRRADEVLGTIKSEVASATGLKSACKVYCGIHDSNASLVPWLNRPAPFTVSSTGTWVINFAIGSDLNKLDPQRDCVANVAIDGQPVACSRWMGGREYAAVAGEKAHAASSGDLAALFDLDLDPVLPAQGGAGGPYAGDIHPSSAQLKDLQPALRHASASLYCALMLDVCLDLCASSGCVIIEGPFAGNELLVRTLAALRAEQEILISSDPTGTTNGAARLALPHLDPPATAQVEPLDGLRGPLDAYKSAWQKALQ